MVARRQKKADPLWSLSRQPEKHTLERTRNYVEYPFEDWGFRRITQIDKSVALGLIDESPHSRDLSVSKVQRLENGTVVDMMNKGAIRTHIPTLWVCKHDTRFWLGEEPKK